MSPESDVGVAERPGTHERAEARPRRPLAGGLGRASSQPKPQVHLLSVTLARGRPVSVLVAGGPSAAHPRAGGHPPYSEPRHPGGWTTTLGTVPQPRWRVTPRSHHPDLAHQAEGSRGARALPEAAWAGAGPACSPARPQARGSEDGGPHGRDLRPSPFAGCLPANHSV